MLAWYTLPTMDVNRKVIVMYLDLSEWSIKDLMELYYTAQELQCGKLIREVKEEFNRRQKFA